MTQRDSPTPTRQPAVVTRRILTRGAAWSVPIVAAAAAAPAFAASASSPLQATWMSATWKPGKNTGSPNDVWSFNIDFANVGDRTLTITAMEIHSTYHDPATNGVADAVVQTQDSLDIVLAVNGTSLLTTSFVPRSVSGTPPEDAQGNILLPSYYNDFTPGDGTISCVSTGALPGDASYPDSCRRLRADHTYIIFSYQTAAASGSIAVYMDVTVPCLVTNDCTS